MHSKRRSGRVAKELPIVLIGTDTAGKVFAEDTNTVVLSRHGAGIISRYRFAPDEVLSIRLPGTAEEAEIRLVGQIGGEPGRYVYGVAFVNAQKPFWPMEFPPPEPNEPPNPNTTLECILCQTRQNIVQAEIEEDVYSVNGNILRFCGQCGTSTPWKMATGPGPVAMPQTQSLRNSPRGLTASSLPLTNVAPQNPSASPSSFSGAAVPETTTLLAEPFPVSSTTAAPGAELVVPLAESTAPQSETPSSPPVPQAQPAVVQAVSGRRVNRRRHVRVRVNYNACIRQGAGEEVVECENMSKGGLCFHSRKEYAVGSRIEVAAPFSPGEPSLFVSAQIKRSEPLPGSQVIRYGIEFVKSSPPPMSYSGSNGTP